MNKRKALAAFGALLLAVISTLALVRYVKGAEDRAVAGEELVDVLVATADIKAGTATADLGDLVESVTVQAKVRPTNAVTAFNQIDGLVTSIDLVKGEQLLTTRFINPGAFQGARSSSVLLPKGANEVTFKLTSERALGGQLRPGDTVTVLASFEPFENETVTPQGELKALPKSPNSSHILLNHVTVVRIQFPEDANTSSKEKNGVGVAPTQDLYVTLAVDQPSLERAVFAAEFGKVWLSYEPPEANATQNKIVIRGNVYEPTDLLLPPAEVLAVPTTRSGDPASGK
jgi:pilus assembly protein CpaB